MLGEIVSEAEGPEFLDKIERVRKLSKSARSGIADDRVKLQETLLDLKSEELVPVARAFSQFLNLANIADQHHTVSRAMDEEFSATRMLSSVFSRLQEQGSDSRAIEDAVAALHIELVLTAHPTEITRRTLIHKYEEVDACLSQRGSRSL